MDERNQNADMDEKTCNHCPTLDGKKTGTPHEEDMREAGQHLCNIKGHILSEYPQTRHVAVLSHVAHAAMAPSNRDMWHCGQHDISEGSQIRLPPTGQIRLQVAHPGRLPMDWLFNGHSLATEEKVEVKLGGWGSRKPFREAQS